MPAFPQFICPKCYGTLRLEDHPATTLQCERCGVWVRLSRLPLAVAFIVSLIVSLLIAQILGLKAYAAILWIPIFLACLRFVPSLVVPLFPVFTVVKGPMPKSARGWRRDLAMFLYSWIAITLYMWVYGFVMGWGAFLFGSSAQDVREIADMWSVPLGLASPAFVVRPEKSLAAVMGIVAANCYFYALGLTLAYKVVHRALQRNRVTQLGLSGRPLDEDDEEP